MKDKDIGRYRILDRLGEGGVGQVYMAVDTRLGRMVALKFLRERLLERPKVRSRFRREALIAAALNHPNICTIYDIDEHRGDPYIVMELLKGRSLDEHVPGTRFDTDAVLEIALPLLDALAVAHARGVIHRDIKPANVFVTDQGNVKLLDFGLARLADGGAPQITHDQPTDAGSDTGTGPLAGTVGYMSPEQARGEHLDGRSDLFSLGVLLYALAAGRQPFPGATPAIVFDRIFNAEPAPLTGLNPGLPRELAQAIGKALHKKAERRFQSADEMRAALQRTKERRARWSPWSFPGRYLPARRRRTAVPCRKIAATVASMTIATNVEAKGIASR